MAERRPPGGNRRNRIALLIGVAAFVGLPILATAINKTIQPQRHAEAGRCLMAETGVDMANSCDFPIIAAYCQRADTTDRNEDTCQLQRLEPAARFTNFPAAPPPGQRYTMACKAPFYPKWGPSLSNPGIQRKQCQRADRALAL